MSYINASFNASFNASVNATNGELVDLKRNLDSMFLLTNAIIVCLMQCGFACLEAGSVRSKNVTNIIMKNLLDIFISGVCYWLVGYTLAYSEGNCFLGYSNWAGVGVPPTSLAHWFFQFVFAATAATIISGAVAERCNFIAYIVYSGVVSGFMYPIVSHWVWDEQGWLLQLGYRDFAGSGAVHLLAGTCSLVGAVILGPRIGRFKSRNPSQMEEQLELAGHSTALVGVGGMILIAGFLAFNGGTLGHVTRPGDGDMIAKVMCNTVLGGCGGSLVILFASKLGSCYGPRSWAFANTLNATFAGMVSVCAAADEMTFWSSFLSGAFAGVVYMAIHKLMIWCRVDDPLDTVGVHFGGGFWGLMSASFFSESGLFYGFSLDSTMLLVNRIVGAAAIIGWSGALSIVMFGTLKIMGVFRVTPEQEMQGLDLALHNEPGYPPMGWHPQPYNLPSLNSPALEKGEVAQSSEIPTYRTVSEFHNLAFETDEQPRG
ncbi:putative ammonium transporter 1 [Anabrus simplex]|uniref:putative ammonium transporter 1 n=1 Tax=Anabrus simplex TaxID=316456 RepID=UPI0035A3709B